jgi:hypothetical protein
MCPPFEIFLLFNFLLNNHSARDLKNIQATGPQHFQPAYDFTLNCSDTGAVVTF